MYLSGEGSCQNTPRVGNLNCQILGKGKGQKYAHGGYPYIGISSKGRYQIYCKGGEYESNVPV